ncbi:MAG: oxygenase MpaB family protein [Pseudomonadales bacterium]|uniref:oxygenase MpaB family protein n=1 Tax=Alcanivorax sp. MD8A TaxID=1177157 RepID=UPI000C9A0452|nr:oxygenase MpaB family protein [Alcanivorax sp. MD8A]MCG8439322.1 oxygenase MpaB family protein [Pseudomonadales bacterium]MEE2869165.1 oxygenase MpaB family protein [Pseudomonadota bacterium]PNE03259.1 hypothetical protein A15D_01195 [Alcanivorax sp. MD8A]
MALPNLLTRQHIQTGLEQAADRCSHPDAGLFGPGSVIWQLLRENLTALAQGRTLLLALANSRLSQLMPSHHDAVQRIQHTQVFLLKVVFGNLDQALVTLNSQKARNKTLFDVDDSDTLVYALSAWVDSCMTVHQSVIEPINSALQERLFEEAMLLAQVMGIPQQALPADWHRWRRWWQHRLARPVSLSPRRQQVLDALLREQGYPGRTPYGAYYPHAAYQLPGHWQQACQLPQRNLDRHRQHQRQLQRLMDITRNLPERLRYQPAFQEAQQRLRGRARADLATRLLNRWWTGESELVSSGWSIPKVDRLTSASY